MKRNNITLGAIGTIAVVAAVLLFPWKLDSSAGNYTKESLSSMEEHSANDAQLWLAARYIDPETGERISDKKLRQITAAVHAMAKSRSISFIEQGPDNIGGRTRAIQVDKTISNVVWAGGVSGGLFRSENGAHLWERVEAFEAASASPNISSMAQLSDGTLFVATGSNDEDWRGNGVWYTQDQGATWSQVPGTATLTKVTEVAAPDGGNTLWLTSSSGLKKWNVGDPTLTSVATGSGPCTALQCSADGSVFVIGVGTNRTYVSTDGGSTWVDKSGFAENLVPSGASRIEYAISQGLNSSGNYSMYAVRTNSNLMGMHVSHDSGNTWSEFIGPSGGTGNLNIYRDQGTYNSIVSVTPQNPEKILIGGIDIWKWEQQANNPPVGGFEKLTEWFIHPSFPKYAHADNHEMKWDGTKLHVGNDGGIGVTYDPEGDWYPANRGYNVTQYYGIAFDRHGAVMGGAQDNGTTYNDHSLSTWKEFREVSGGDGFQCEISFFNPNVLFTTSQFGNAQRSADRGNTFDSFFPSIAGVDPFGTEGSPNHPFHTNIFLAEYYDENSEDSVIYIPEQGYSANDVILIPSLSSGDSIRYTTPTTLYFSDTLNYESSLSTVETSIVNSITGQTVYLDLYDWSHYGTSGSGQNPPLAGDSLLVNFPSGASIVVVQSTGTFTHYYGQNTATGEVADMGIDSVLYNIAWDTLTIQDPYQSWYFMYVNRNGGELWGTRNALRFSVTDLQWGVVARGIGAIGTPSNTYSRLDIAFSKDLNHIYVSSGGSTVSRIDGLGSLYTSSSTFETDAFYDANGISGPAVATVTSFMPGGTVEGIAVNPSDPDDVLVLNGFGSSNIRRSANGTSAAPTFTAIGSIAGLNSPATYDAIIDRDDPNILVVGTSHGVFVTEDGGASWEDASVGFAGTPVFEVRQSFYTWDEGNFRPGEIYVGTYGRGIWSSSSYLGTTDMNGSTSNNTKGEVFKTNLVSYPNPATSNTTLTFNLETTSDVTIRVYNLAGKLVKEINRKNIANGAQSVSFGVNDLSNGTYIVKLVAGSQKATTKFIKM